jgi:mono/diheme cytochrome c family protein
VALASSCRGGGQAAQASTGQALYNTNCATCHGASGQGVGEFPKVVGAADVLGGDYARTVIAQGRNKMPSFGGKLTPAQIDAIVDYIATFQ